MRKYGVNHRAKRIIIRKVALIKTIGVTKMRGNFVEISFQTKFLRKAPKSQEFRRNSFALLLHNTVLASFTFGQDEEMENILQAEGQNKSQEMEKTNIPEHMEVMECVDEQSDFLFTCDEPTEI